MRVANRSHFPGSGRPYPVASSEDHVIRRYRRTADGLTVSSLRCGSLRDVPQADPAQSKALAQELIVKEKVQYLAGFYFTPDAMAVTPILKQGNVPMVVMNAATSAIVTYSAPRMSAALSAARSIREAKSSPASAC